MHPSSEQKIPSFSKWADKNRHSVVTNDRSTMIEHAIDHERSGGRTSGIFILRDGFSLSRIVDDLYLIWSASEAEEWTNQVRFIPFSDG